MKRVLVIVHKHWQEDQWEQAYWLILGHLSFDHQVRLLFLPGAIDHLATSAHAKQWRALDSYGIDGSFTTTQNHTDFLNAETASAGAITALKQWAELIL